MENPAEKVPSSERESKETAPDFLKIFNDKLQNIKPIVGKEAKDWASWYNDPEITEIAKEVPAVLFDPNHLNDSGVSISYPTDIWIEDPKDLDMSSHWVHDQIIEKLGQFMGKSVQPFLLSVYILESGNGIRYIILDNPRARIIEDMQERNVYEQDGFTILDLLNKYNISKVIEKVIVKKETVDESGMISRENGPGFKDVIGKSMLDKRGEDIFFINLARKHGMTNNQYLRLKILAKSLFEAGQQASLDEVARSIVKDADNINIPIKQLPLEER